MMFPIRQLGDVGVITDLPPYDLPLNAFTKVENCVFRDGKLRPAPGWFPIEFSVGVTDPGVDLSWFQPWQANDAVYVAFFGVGTIRVWNGSVLSTPSTLPALATSTDWNTEVFGEHVIATNFDADPVYAGDDGDVWAELPGWNAAGGPLAPCKVIRSHKALLFALGLSGRPYTVAWSDIGKLGDVPDNWDSTDPASFAGTLDLQASDGEIVTGEVLGDALIVYCQYATYALFPTGNVTNPISVRRLFSRGAVSAESVQPFDNYHFVVDSKAIYAHDGSKVERVADRRVERAFFSEVSEQTRIRTAINPDEQEVLVYYPWKDSTVPNRIMRWNWPDNVWSFEDPETEIQCIKAATIPGATVTWDDLVTAGWTWNFLAANGIRWSELGAKGQLFLPYQLETRKWSQREFGISRDGEPYYAYAERLYIDLDELTKTTHAIHEVSRLLPQITGVGLGVFFQIGFARSPGGAITWKTPRPFGFSFDVDQYKVDVRGSGRYLCWRVGVWPSSLAIPISVSWELSGMDVEVRPDGLR